MPISSVSKPGPHRSATSSPELHAPASAKAKSAETAEALVAIDEELARQAEQTLQQDLAETQFDLEGDFLSQAEIAKIMAAEAGGNSPVDDEQATSADGSAGVESLGRQSADHPVEPAAPTAGQEAEAAVEPGLAPSQDQPIVELAGTQDAQLIASDVADVTSPADSQDVDQQPAGSMDSVPVAAESVGRSAGGVNVEPAPQALFDPIASDTPVAASQSADGPAAAVANEAASSAAPSAEIAKHADSSASKATPSTGPAGAIKPRERAEPSAGGASPQPAGEIAASADSGEDGDALPRWQQVILSVATTADIPFAGLPRLVKMILGIAGVAAFLAGVAVWVMGR